MATISIIVPVYNKAPWLERCFDSLVNQTDQSAEVIVIEDGSTDGGDKICKRYAKEYGWTLISQKNAGVSVARNKGIDKASGDYIAFCDADDFYEPEAVEVMKNMAKDFRYNIIQFGQSRQGVRAHPQSPRGDYELPARVQYWEFTTNKLYRRSFLLENNIRFIEGLQFGEDEMFNVEAFIANHGLRQANPVIYQHWFDDKNSLCRGGLDLDKLQVLEKLLRERLVKQVQEGGEQWVDGAEWLIGQLRVHYESKTFKRFGFSQKPRGEHDIVYFVKNTPHNEELRYSLRSVEANWLYNDVWFYGGKPWGIEPDHYVPIEQRAATKWENVRNMMIEACKNDEITEDFWLFNDDFFILAPISKDFEPRYDGTLTSKIEEMRAKRGGEDSEWSKNLGRLRDLLKSNKRPEFCYAIHEPMLVNRKKMLKVLEKFPDEPMFRALYGNWWKIGGVQESDPKYALPEPRDIADRLVKHDIISTSDDSFQSGYVGRWLRDRFDKKSRFEGE